MIMSRALLPAGSGQEPRRYGPVVPGVVAAGSSNIPMKGTLQDIRLLRQGQLYRELTESQVPNCKICSRPSKGMGNWHIRGHIPGITLSLE